MTDLLPCPFCGCKARILETQTDVAVACEGCCVENHFINDIRDTGRSRAIAAWNRRALSARDERVEERGWMPIETAPGDGRLILVFDERNEPAQTVEMRKADGGFWRWMISQKCATPTHWRELPAPPAALRAGGTDGH